MMMVMQGNVVGPIGRPKKVGTIARPSNLGCNNNGVRRFKVWEELFEVDARYVVTGSKGKGAYGVVCSCIDMATFEEVAIKKVKVEENSKEALKVLREVNILRHTRHHNVVALKDVMVESERCRDVYLVFECMDTDLGTFISSNPLLPNYKIKHLMFQLLNGLKYLHDSRIIHRDLKPGNLLVNGKGELKICDFGLATTTKGLPETQPVTEYVVTRWYRPPELLLCCPTYGPSVDVWSVGCIFAELLGGKPVFPGKDALDQVSRIIRVLGTQDESNLEFVTSLEYIWFLRTHPYESGVGFERLFPYSDPVGLDLLKRMLEFDPSKRITAAEALQHPYLRSFHDCHMCQPVASPCEVDVEADIGVDRIRELIWAQRGRN